MNENKQNGDEKESGNFIHEKVIGKKASDLETRNNLLKAAAAGAVFGITAAVCFAILVSLFNGADSKQAAEETTAEETSVLSTEAESESEEDSGLPEDERELERFVNNILESRQDEEEENFYKTVQNALSGVSGSLVTIAGSGQETDLFSEDYTTSFTDCGIIVRKTDEAYYVLTGYTALKDAEDVKVVLHDGAQVDGSLTGFDSTYDIAIVSFNIDDAESAIRALGAEKNEGSETAAEDGIAVCGVSYSVMPELADPVFAVGSPAGIAGSVSVGFVSAIDENLRLSDRNLNGIVSDVQVNSSSSSFLMGTDGKLYGVYTAASPSVGDNYSECLGMGGVMIAVNRIIDGETTASLGVIVRDIEESVKAEYQIPDGIYVESVVKDSGAYNAGIQAGDVISKVGDTAVASVSDYEAVLTELTGDKPVSVTVNRDSKGVYYEITVDAKAEICQK